MEQIQRKAAKMSRGIKHLSQEKERLRHLGLFSLENSMLHGGHRNFDIGNTCLIRLFQAFGQLDFSLTIINTYKTETRRKKKYQRTKKNQAQATSVLYRGLHQRKNLTRGTSKVEENSCYCQANENCEITWQTLLLAYEKSHLNLCIIDVEKISKWEIKHPESKSDIFYSNLPHTFRTIEQFLACESQC